MSIEENAPIVMSRPTLDRIPEHALPQGFSFHWYEPGDESKWVAIHILADKFNEIGMDLYRKEFGDDETILRERQCFLLDPEGNAIGTATAWHGDESHGTEWGRVHWVAIVPTMQGRGLAKPLLSTVCERLRSLGHRKAYLVTSTARIPAINLYRSFGFQLES